MIFDFGYVQSIFIEVLSGIPVTLRLTTIVLLISIPCGLAITLCRRRWPKTFLSKIFDVYCSFARGTPIMVMIYLLYSALPTAVARYTMEKGIDFNLYGISGTTYAYFILSFCTTATMAEMFRSGLNAVDKGQLEAAKSVGMSAFQGYYRIVFPQAVVNVLPVLCTNITNLVKMTSLTFAVSVFEITAIAKTAAARSSSYLEAYLVIAIIYVVINLSIEAIFKLIERKVKVYHSL